MSNSGLACRSFVEHAYVCADGFMQKPFCAGHGGCATCGHVSASALPYCLREEMPPQWIHDHGRPLFYRRSSDPKAGRS